MGWLKDLRTKQSELKQWLRTELVHIPHGAGAGTARIATTAAPTCRGSAAAGRAFGGDRKHGELRRQLLAVALGAFRLLAAVDQRFKLMATLFAGVLEDWHGLIIHLAAAAANTI